MARILTRGFETGTAETLNSFTSFPNISGIARSGGYSIYMNILGECGAQYPIPSSIELYAGYAFYLNNLQYGEDHFIVRSGATTTFSITNTTANTLQFRYLTTVVYTSPVVVSTGGWIYIEVHVARDPTNGIMELKINGELVYSNTSASTGTAALDSILFRKQGSRSDYFRIDDVVVNDTTGVSNNGWTGQPKLVPVLVNGVGDATDLSRGGTDTGANWSQVNTIPASDTSYVYGDASDERDLYTVDVSAFSLPENTTIQNLHTVLRSRVESGAGGIAGALQAGYTEVESERSSTLSSSYNTYTFDFPVNPETTLNWTVDDLDTVQIGPKLKDVT
jgi:hypothetical protein